MLIYLIRHGQTHWNLLKRYQGQTDIPLTDTGREQARRAGAYLAKETPFEALYCSDLSRTKETAQLIGEQTGLVPVEDSRLRELAFGEWEGLDFTEVYAKYPEEFDNWFKDTYTMKVPGGESFAELLTRSSEALEEIMARHQNKVMIVTHGGVIKALLSICEAKVDLWQTGVEPGTITILNKRGETLYPLTVGLVP